MTPLLFSRSFSLQPRAEDSRILDATAEPPFSTCAVAGAGLSDFRLESDLARGGETAHPTARTNTRRGRRPKTTTLDHEREDTCAIP
jgi:hypothetical protein